jgi:RimJ/RimL family protein N-acetyltransferase
MFPSCFDPNPSLNNAQLSLRPLQSEDHDALAVAAADPKTWAGHPNNDRHKPDIFAAYFAFLLNSGGTLVIRNASEDVIGCTRYYSVPGEPDNVSIGFTFLSNKYWGGAVNRHVKSLMLDHAFAVTDIVWFHIDPTNIRSQKATAKLGAIHHHNARLTLAATPADWMCFALTKADWASEG